ncbi:hypothetical protein LO762_16435 [Actinocorallia sp. API 0066]|uniref:hypothetical protein n=1 Tax=Actinocorallia sp. API 0066 TaxID=2896846 RepID=UPI001E349AB9|nr:hypothetical protein [Actinocorallia sp. API 0066]MCD0450766.1 hypothetical protein [Actinocorallia sp. API 0066]
MGALIGLPIWLAIGDSDPIEVATVDIPARVDGAAVTIRDAQARRALAEALRALADVLEDDTEQE